ncbi:2-oxoacid:acceptor oxidoreductase family protein [Peptoniphilus sp. AGMB00490]|uniref:2-oxoacid:acceptor oxidoreductase family protein n=1 Tax=Peptoniphilus faecalis TaxID=2731255 RepID=A0A848RIC4_9FIRM|nr:2-oxoacid:acceptor oxidoreductase family protein [Peptoniphilus faecalis]NMW85745.1 2-oxoacid:acceptor oxidoreductase family protein [Peptoniphilus faecalis]
MNEILIAGFGGQGVLTAGKILIEVGANAGKEVTWTTSYGAEMRGGTASCGVILANSEIGTPYSSKYDYVLALNGPSYEKYYDVVKPGGKMIVNSSIVNIDEKPKNVGVYGVKANEICHNLDYLRGVNIVMLGAFIKANDIFTHDEFLRGLEEYFKAKGRYDEVITNAFEAGYEKTNKI